MSKALETLLAKEEARVETLRGQLLVAEAGVKALRRALGQEVEDAEVAELRELRKEKAQLQERAEFAERALDAWEAAAQAVAPATPTTEDQQAMAAQGPVVAAAAAPVAAAPVPEEDLRMQVAELRKGLEEVRQLVKPPVVPPLSPPATPVELCLELTEPQGAPLEQAKAKAKRGRQKRQVLEEAGP